jgi:hypothetical protein
MMVEKNYHKPGYGKEYYARVKRERRGYRYEDTPQAKASRKRQRANIARLQKRDYIFIYIRRKTGLPIKEIRRMCSAEWFNEILEQRIADHQTSQNDPFKTLETDPVFPVR